MASRRNQRRREQRGNKQHLFDGGEEVDPEMLKAHRELEFIRAGARVRRSSAEQARHLEERSRKLAAAMGFRR